VIVVEREVARVPCVLDQRMIIMTTEQTTPIAMLRVVNSGVARPLPTPAWKLKSNVGHGLIPRPLPTEVRLTRMLWLGLIQAIQSKYERALKMYPGNQ
jgi:hypothetical protein